MNVLIFNYEYPPLGGGAANATWYLLRELSKRRDIHIDLITSSTAGFYRKQPYENTTIHYLDIGKRGNIHYQSNRELLRYAWKSYWYARGLLRRGSSFDLVHAFFGIPSGYVAMKLKLPYIVSLRGSDVPFYNQRFALADKLLFKRLSGKVWKNARCVVANSGGLRELAKSSYPGMDIKVIPNGIDTEVFTPSLCSKSYSGELHIVSTGRLIQRKGFDILISSLTGLENVRLTLVGDGPERQPLAAQAEEIGVRVEFAGAVDHHCIPDLLQSADLFVLPSRNEGMSNSVLEAMACGLPIIATDVGGSKELVDGNGFIVSRDQIGQLRKTIHYYLENREKLTEHGWLSRKLAEAMDWSQAAEEYYQLYIHINGST